MSLVGDAEAAIGAVTGASWWRLALKLAPWVAIVALAFGLQATRQTLALARSNHKAELARRDKEAFEQSAIALQRLVHATDDYAARTAAMKPLIIRSTDTVREYAQTPAGRVVCRDADRVRSIDELDATLAAAGTAQGGGTALQPDPSTSSAGR